MRVGVRATTEPIAELTLSTRCRRRCFSELTSSAGTGGALTRAPRTSATFEVPLAMLHRKGLRAWVRVGELHVPIDWSGIVRVDSAPATAFAPGERSPAGDATAPPPAPGMPANVATAGDDSDRATGPRHKQHGFGLRSAPSLDTSDGVSPRRRPARPKPRSGCAAARVARVEAQAKPSSAAARPASDWPQPIAIDPTLLQFLPYEDAAPRLAVPISLSGDVLTVAVALPSVDLSIITDRNPWLRLEREVTGYHRIVQALREVEAMQCDGQRGMAASPRRSVVSPRYARAAGPSSAPEAEPRDGERGAALRERRAGIGARIAHSDLRPRLLAAAVRMARAARSRRDSHDPPSAGVGAPTGVTYERPRGAVAGAVAGIAATVGLMLVSPQQSQAQDISARIAADTMACVGALVAAYLALSCYRMRRSAGSLALATGLATLALTTALAVGGLRARPAIPGSPWANGIVGVLSTPTALLIAHIVCLVVLAAAALGLAVRSRHSDERLLGWCSVGVLCLAVAQANVVLGAADPASWLSQADVFRLAAIASFLVGAALQLVADGHGLASDAVAAERRRMARELHDGVAQELAFIVSQASSLARDEPPSGPMQSIALAGERALKDSRRSIHTLTRPDRATLRDSIAEQATLWARRAGLELELEISDDVETSPEVQHAILRVVQEAISNAVRHAGATRIMVNLSQCDGSVTVRISDDGRGFDTLDVGHAEGGFGLVSMAERAEAFGGELRLTSEPGHGTVVEVAFG